MMLPTASLALLWASMALAQTVIDDLSFGHKHGISTNSFSIPGWSMVGEGYVPQIMSDKVILTPPYGGNKRGALWTEAKSSTQNWQGTLEFRVGGVDHGKANLALWYAKQGSDTISASSIYTAGKFDGLAIVIDTNAGIQKIRGFLNDGTIEYRSHPHVDGLAFGHCEYNYRNLGRPSKLQVKSTLGGLEVLIDDRQCFSTNKINLPSSDYGFGLTAASNDPPDSIEVFKFEVASVSADSSSPPPPVPPASDQQTIRLKPVSQNDKSTTNTGSDTFSNDMAYQTLTQRLNALEKSIQNMFTELNRHTAAEESRYNEILSLLKTPSTQSQSQAQIQAQSNLIESRLSTLDRALNLLSADLKSSLNHDDKFAQLSNQLQQTHEGVTTHLPGKMREYVSNHTPRIGFIVFSFMAFQSACLAVLLWGKWRKGRMPKKFL